MSKAARSLRTVRLGTPPVTVPAVLSFSFLLPCDNGLSPDFLFSFWIKLDEVFLSPGSPADGSLPSYMRSILGAAFVLEDLCSTFLLLYFLQSLPETPIVEINVLHLTNCIFFPLLEHLKCIMW